MLLELAATITIFWGDAYECLFFGVNERTPCTRALAPILPDPTAARIGVRTAPVTSILCFSSLRILHPMPSRNFGRGRKNNWLVGSWIQVFRWRWVGEGSAWWHLCPKICKLRWAVMKLLLASFVWVFFLKFPLGLLADVFKCQLMSFHDFMRSYARSDSFRVHHLARWELTIQHMSQSITASPAPSGGPYPSHFRSQRWPLDFGFAVWKGDPQRSQSSGWVHGSVTWRRVWCCFCKNKTWGAGKKTLENGWTMGITLESLDNLRFGLFFFGAVLIDVDSLTFKESDWDPAQL